MQIQDPLELLNPDRLNALASFLGTPPPATAQLLGEPGRQARYGLRFAPETGIPPQVLWIDRVPNPTGFALPHHLAALMALEYVESIPTRSTFNLIPAGLFGVPSAICPYEDIISGNRLLAIQGAEWTRLARDMGSVLATLHSTAVIDFGTRADGGRFVPMRGSWREEWSTYVESCWRGAEFCGTDLGPLSDALLAAARDRYDALDSVQDFALVHGEMMAKHLFYRSTEGGAELVLVEGWDQSMAGDPLIDIAHALTSPAEAVAGMLTSYGTDRARAWLEPDTMRRLELYALTGVLRRTRTVADLLLNTRDMRAVEALDLAATEARFVLEPGALKTRLERAIKKSVQPTSTKPPRVALDPDTPARERLRTALALLRVDPVVDLANAPVVLASLGAALLGYEVPGYRERTSQVVDHLVIQLPRYGLSTSGEALADPETFLHGLATESLQQIANTGALPCTSLSLLAFAVRAYRKLDGSVSSRTLPRLESLVRAMRRDEWTTATGGGRVVSGLAMTQAILGLAALQLLSEDVPNLDEALVQACRAELENAALDEVERIRPGHFPTPTKSVSQAALDQAMMTAREDQTLTRPVFVYALRAVGDSAVLPDAIEQLVELSGQ